MATHRTASAILILTTLILTTGAFGGCECGAPGSRTDAGDPGSDAVALPDATGFTDAIADAASDSTTPGTDAAPADAGPPILFPCGPSGLECDAARQVCVELYTAGAPSVWECRPLPASCQGNHTCACLGQAFGICPPNFWWCSDLPEDYTLRCEWLKI